MFLQARTILYFLFIVLIVSGSQASCSREKAEASSSNPASNVEIKEAQKLITPTPSPSPPNSPIRKFDFGNFTFSTPTYGYLGRKEGIGYLGPSNGKYRLKNGTEPAIRDREDILKNSPASLDRIDYADLTGDGEEEAMIVLGIQTGGSAIPNELYVYTWDKSKPKEIFSFSTGDRADGGLRKMYTDQGHLIIELNAGDEKAPECDGCQSTRFSRIWFKWNGRKFMKVNQELLPIK